MQTDNRLFGGRGPDSRPRKGADRRASDLSCAICTGPLADHDMRDHASRVVERMLRIGFPTPVSPRLP